MAKDRCGVLQGEKVLFVVEEDDLVEEDFLIYLTEFIVSGSITPLFSYEDQTTIINSIRTEVTQAGLTYTRQVAWQFFLRSASLSLTHLPSNTSIYFKHMWHLTSVNLYHISNLSTSKIFNVANYRYFCYM